MKTLKVTSKEFQNNTMIPRRFTCDGDDINPEIKIEGVPSDAKSLVLIMDDPDAPRGTWDHWIVFDIEPTLTLIKEDSVPGKEAMTSSGQNNYGGPCPPTGVHRYFFKAYALDKKLNLSTSSDKKSVENAMNGHILAKGELIGLYKRG